MTDNQASADALFDQLQSIKKAPSEAVFKEIEQCKTLVIPLLLAEIEAFSLSPLSLEKQGDDYIRHVISLFLLAYFREQAAYPHIIQLISHEGDEVIKLTGEVFTEALGRIIASVYDGDLQPIKSVVENPKLNPWIRSGALDSLMVLWKEDVMSRDEVIHYLKTLMDEKLERVPSYVWDSVALIAYDLHPKGLEDSLILAIRDHLIAPMVINLRSLKACLNDDMSSVIKNKDKVIDGYIKSPEIELTWWLNPDTKALETGDLYANVGVPIAEKKVEPGERIAPMGWRSNTIVRTTPKVGRNAPCPCGSGKKFKKCCAT